MSAVPLLETKESPQLSVRLDNLSSPHSVRGPDSGSTPSSADGRARRRRGRRRSDPPVLVGAVGGPNLGNGARLRQVESPNYAVGRLTPSQKATLEGLGCSTFREGVAASHPILAWCRRMAENVAYLKARRMAASDAGILDWSGSMLRHARFGRGIRVTRPEITPDDVVANREAMAMGHPATCNCLIDDECRHCARAEVSMSVDVLYYYSPAQIVRAILRTTTRVHVAAVHGFADSNLYDEATCRYNNDGPNELVTMCVKGNSQYTHKVPHWIYSGGTRVEIEGPDGLMSYQLNATLHREIGPMLVVVITIGDSSISHSRIPRTRVSKLWDREGKPEALMRKIAATHRVGPSALTLRQYKSRLENLAENAGYDVSHPMFAEWQSAEFFLEESERYVGVVAWLTTKFGFNNIDRAEKLVSGDLSWTSWFYAHWQRRPSWLVPLISGLALGAGLVFSRKRPALAGPGALGAFCGLAIASTCVGDTHDERDPDTKYRDTGIPAYCMPKFGARQVGFYFPFCNPAIMASCVHNQKAAVLLRAINPAPDVDVAAWTEAAEFVQNVPELSVTVNVGDWLDKYPGARRKQLVDAFHRVSEFGLTRSDYHKSRGFVKREFYLEKDRDKPRLIQARTDPYLVELGPWVWSYQKLLGQVLNHTNDYFYVCGSSAEEIGSWVSDCAGMYMYECDHSAFDSSVSLQALWFEFSCYQKSKPPKEIWDLLLGQLHTSGSTSGGVQYKYRGRRNSGVPNTSVGNSLINLAALAYGFKGSRVRIMVLGDDSVIASDRLVNTSEVIRRLSRLGFRSKLVYRPIIYDLEFCSALFWPTDDGLVLGPKPGRVLAKSYWDKTPRSEKKHRAWLRGVLQSQLLDTWFVPVLNKCIQFGLIALGEGHVINNPRDHRIHSNRLHLPNVETYAMFKYRYGIGPECFEPTSWALNGYQWEILSNVDNGSNIHHDRVQGLTLSILDHPSVLKSHLYTVLAAPVIEEVAKRSFSPSWWAGALFGFVEGLLYGDLPFRVAAHTLLQCMPMPVAIVGHVLWNVYATASGSTNSGLFDSPTPPESSNTTSQPLPRLSMAQGRNKSKSGKTRRPANRVAGIKKPALRTVGAPARQHNAVSSPAAKTLAKDVADYLRLCISPSYPGTARIPDDSNASSSALKLVTRFQFNADVKANLVISPATPYRLYSFTQGLASDPVNPVTQAANYDDMIAIWERVRVVSACVEIVQSYAANQNPGIAYCTAIPAGAPLLTTNQLQFATTVHVEPMFNGCYMRYTQSVNPVTGRGQYINLETEDQFLDRMQVSIVGGSAGLVYEAIITCNYELISSPLGLGATLASKPPVAKPAAEKVQQIVSKLPTNATRDFVLEHKATSSLGSKLMDAAGDVAASLVDSMLPKPLASVVKGIGSAIAGLF